MRIKKRMDELGTRLKEQNDRLEKVSYASVTAGNVRKTENQTPKRTTLHSVVITSKDEMDTGEKVLEKVREVVDAKEGWIQVQKVRKARDRKVIIGLSTKEDRNRMKERLSKDGVNLSVEEVENRDPMLMLRSVLAVNSDDDIAKALRNQNRTVFRDLDPENDRIKVRYRRKTRNPHTNHVVVSVSPTIWRRSLDVGVVHIDLQRIKVEDQSPLVQCTRCLSFGHGKRYCREAVDLCGHCGGPHMRTECSEWLANEPAKCKNCEKAGNINTEHNAFSLACPVRKKWDELARATVAYC